MIQARRRPRLGCWLWLGVIFLLAYGVSYFFLGVTPAFIMGMIRGALEPPHSPADILVPEGVRVSVWAQGLASPTSLAFGPDGRLYISELGGKVIALADHDADGAAETRTTFASNLTAPLGLAFYESDLYVGQRGSVVRLRDGNDDGVADETAIILDGLPALRHQTDGIAFGPDGRLYIGQGSTSDRGETGRLPLEAAILVAERDGSGLRVFASGTRNSYDLAFYPGTNQLFATDNGRDVPGSGVPDELNLIVDGGNYGWPGCWGRERGSGCEGTLPPIVELAERAAVTGLTFYTGDLFPQWRNHAFVCLYGSNSGDPNIGRKVQRIELSQTVTGWTGVVSDFASGFDRPLDVTTGPDGALYIVDFGTGIVYQLGK
jgi:putative membrane-bound dehydrogenase-like protein